MKSPQQDNTQRNNMNDILCKYPVGIQTFERVIEDGLVYIDKTDLVWKIAHLSPFVFLSRPRRFGKSLLTTTLLSYFQGHRDLFEGLKIMDLEKEWKQYPVIHLDMSTAKNKGSAAELQRYLNLYITERTPEYIKSEQKLPGEKLEGLIRELHKATGEKVVILIDEYDSPLLDVLHEKEHLKEMKRVMQEFYQPLKACEGLIRFCFITGITKFSQLSIFSTLNNISNVSMHPEFSAICGITETEFQIAMREDIEMMAHEYGCSWEEMHARLKWRYDGYKFSRKSEDIYNPYSLMSCFMNKEIKDFWFESGTSSYLFEQMKRFGTDITKMDEIVATERDFNLPTENLTDALPLLYQAGYLTIKDYDPESEAYSLKIPNQEVRIGFAKGLMPVYAGLGGGNVQLGCAFKIWKALKMGDVDLALSELKAFLAGVPYVEGFKDKLKDAVTKEGFYEYTFYLILSMLNVYVQTQVKCWTGKTDMIVYAPDTIYVFEFKVRDSAEKALAQIEDKGYADRFATDSRKVVRVGVNFDINNWNIKDWRII